MVVGAAAAVGEGDGVVRGIFGFEGAACGRGMGICKGRRGDGVTEGAKTIPRPLTGLERRYPHHLPYIPITSLRAAALLWGRCIWGCWPRPLPV